MVGDDDIGLCRVNMLATGDGDGPGWEYPDIQTGPKTGELVK